MIIRVDGFGLLRQYFKNLEYEAEEGTTVGDIVLRLNESYGLRLFIESPQKDGAWPYVILINGRSIFQMQGLGTVLKDGDRLSFFIMIDGG